MDRTRAATTKLADFAAGLKLESVPDSAVEKVKQLFLDSIGCALSADFSDEIPSYTDFARTLGGPGDTLVLGSGERLSLLGATLLGGYRVTAMSACDVYLAKQLQVTPAIVPPALGIAQGDGNSGACLLEALVLGSEVSVRLADAMGHRAADTMDWHLPGVVGPYGAAATVGHLRKFDTDRFSNAFGLAGSQSAGTWASLGTPALKFHQSRGAASGLIAALLAEQGFQASADIIGEPDGGLLATYAQGGDIESGFDGLGDRWRLEQISTRLWPAGTSIQPLLTALMELQSDERLEWDRIDHVQISVAPSVYRSTGYFGHPKGSFEATHSFQFIAAAMLRDGQYSFESVVPDNYAAPEVTSFMGEKVELEPDESVTADASRVKVTLKSREVLTSQVSSALGTPGNPTSRSDVEDKFLRCAEGRLDDNAAADLVDFVSRLEEIEDLSPFYRLLASAPMR